MLGKVLTQMFVGSVQIVSRLDTQSKFQTSVYTFLATMLHGVSVVGFVNLRKTFRPISDVWQKLGEMPFLPIYYNYSPRGDLGNKSSHYNITIS